jgi:hypothetical protein
MLEMHGTLTVTTVLATVLALFLAFAFNQRWFRKRSVVAKAPPKPRTFRISGILQGLSRQEFRDILTNLRVETSSISPVSVQLELLGWSFALGHSRQSSIATATFCPPPATDQLRSAIRKEIKDSNYLRVDTDFFGLTPLADPAELPAVE